MDRVQPHRSTRTYRLACRWLCCALLTLLATSVGCGTTRTSASGRTATEQLLISDAIDRAVEEIDFRALSGQSVYLKDSALNSVVDKDYLASSMRQHLLASGCVLRTSQNEADFIVEARAGAVGTDDHNLLFGIPAMQVPQILPLQGLVPSAIPEVPVAKRQEQRGVAKLAVFAYHRETGMPVWQSGLAMSESNANNIWVLGAGPFKKGTIYDGTRFAGDSIPNPLAGGREEEKENHAITLKDEASFASPNLFAEVPPEALKAAEELPKPVRQATHEQKK